LHGLSAVMPLALFDIGFAIRAQDENEMGTPGYRALT
jgi:hypothetical protein